MPFDWDSAVQIREGQPPPKAGELEPGQEPAAQPVETKIDFDWSTAKSVGNEPELIGGVENQGQQLEIKALPEKKENAFDAIRRISKEYPILGPGIAPGEELGRQVGESLDIGGEEARNKEIARAQAVYSLSQATGIPLHDVNVNFDTLIKDPGLTGFKTEPTPMEILDATLPLTLPLPLFQAPAATIKGILLFGAIDKFLPDLEGFLPEGTQRSTRDTVQFIDLMWKTFLTAGLHRRSGPMFREALEKFTLNKIHEYKLHTTIKLTGEQIKDIWQTGNLTTEEQKAFVRALDLTTAQIKLAFKKGITINIPAQKITRFSDMPWFEKVKSLFGLEPASGVKTSTAGLLPSPEMKVVVEAGGGIFEGFKPTIMKGDKMVKFIGDRVFFSSAKTGQTFSIKADELSPERIREELAKGEAEFQETVSRETSRLDEEATASGAEKFQGSEKRTRGTGQAKVNPEDLKAAIKGGMGNFDQIRAIQTPELLKLAKALSESDVSVKKSLGKALGQFLHVDYVAGFIELAKDVFKDPALAQGVLAHEIGHLVDWLDDKTLLRGNILGRLASVLDYRASLLPGSPKGEPILTEADRVRIRKEAEKLVRERAGGKKDEVSSQFDPDMILSIWNQIESKNVPPELVDYIKRLDTEGKKSIVKAALQARKKGEPVTIEDIQKFKKEFDADPEAVSKVYADLIREEIKKRNLFDIETISEELKALTKWWHPFNEAAVPPSYLKYRYNSKELYAEFISVLLNAPAQALARAPKAYEAFWNYIGNKPDVLATLLDTQALIQGSNGELYKQRGQDIKGMFETGEQLFRARQLRYEEAKKSIWFLARNAFWDKNNSILEKLPEIKKELAKEGRVLDPNRDPKNLLEKNDFVASVVRGSLEMLDPVLKEIYDGNLMNDVDLFMFSKRIIGDRSEFANPLGHNPETAQAQLDFMAKQEPEKFQQIERLVSQIQDWMKTEINPMMNDIYTPEQVQMIGSNDSYAPFRVLDFLKDYVSAGIIAQTGTIKEIASPFTALVMKATSMASAAVRNDITKKTGQFLLRAPDQFEMRPAKITDFYDGKRRHFSIENPPDKTMGTIAWREHGKWKAYHTDRFIADIFNNSDNGYLMAVGQLIDKVLLNNALFRPMWITFNVTFQARNLFRDFLRTWKANPEMTIGRTLQSYAKAVKPALAKVKGEFDPLINEMYKNAAIGVTFNDLLLGETGQETELQKLLARYDILPDKKSKASEIPVLGLVFKLLDGIRFVGDVIETIPKVAGWMNLNKLPTEKRAYIVRNLIGTPNYKRSGRLKPISNSAFLFSNIIKEGFRGMFELSTDPELRGQYWKKTMIANMLPKFLLAAALLGLFGEKKKREVEGITEYDKTNYIVIPLGENESGETQYLRLPQDEDGRFIGAITWKLINGMKDPERALRDIFSFTAGQLPSPAPALDLASKWGQWIAGQTPRDEYRGRDILSRDQRAAGGFEAFEPMAIWTANQTGMSGFQVYDRMKDQTLWKKFIALTPIVQSFYRETNYGRQEELRDVLIDIQGIEARERIRLQNEIDKDPEAAIEAQESDKDKNKVRRKITRQAVKSGTDPLARVLLQATSNNQKLGVFKAAFDQFGSSQELQNYLNESVQNKIISEPLSNSIMDEYDKSKRKTAKQ